MAERLPKLTRAEMEQTARQLVGRRLDRVTYFELAYEGVSRPSWNFDPRHDSLDFGLDLHTTDGQTFGVVWDWDFCRYGLSLRPTSVRYREFSCAEWDVMAASRWAAVRGHEIAAARIRWESETEDDGECPQQIELRFANGRLVRLLSSEYIDGVAREFADHVAVVFDSDTDGSV